MKLATVGAHTVFELNQWSKKHLSKLLKIATSFMLKSVIVHSEFEFNFVEKKNLFDIDFSIFARFFQLEGSKLPIP